MVNRLLYRRKKKAVRHSIVSLASIVEGVCAASVRFNLGLTMHKPFDFAFHFPCPLEGGSPGWQRVLGIGSGGYEYLGIIKHVKDTR